MIIGVPKEIKEDEKRVSLVPSGVQMLTQSGHRVLVENDAGVGAGFSDEEYRQAGAEIFESGQALWQEAQMIVKVKEPLPGEYQLIQEGQIILTFLHLAAVPQLARVLAEKKAVAVAYETIEGANRSLPLLEPMSEIAGRMATQIGARLLESTFGGRGVLMGGVPGVPPADVVIIGGGTVGVTATRVAIGMGAQVTILDINSQRLREIYRLFDGRIVSLMSNSYSLERVVQYADLLIGAVLLPGGRAPRLVTEAMVKTMKPGAVIIDVAIDQGGIVETIDRVTTHSNPTYSKHGVLHYAVPNMPGAVPRTATFALTNVTTGFVLELANKGYKAAFAENEMLAAGANVVHGHFVHPAVAEAVNMDYTPLNRVLQQF
ncbi:alanine dehydrogenase [Dethiobacter alkaliphilus]|uniref:alanine dehydrogenase n=1 Tax=Dethiobacter alkaliphilus TaxID=427926 RepID=UPI002226D030|nr:alanine dehydrogenase [Dethiobacter alkaliphilus]MCW3490244.1 alanine dehydrogenase [Dethiobacter alkaliphilus]